MGDRRGTPVYLHSDGHSERMGWIRGRGDLPSLLRQFATYVERGGDNRDRGVVGPDDPVPPPPEPPDDDS